MTQVVFTGVYPPVNMRNLTLLRFKDLIDWLICNRRASDWACDCDVNQQKFIKLAKSRKASVFTACCLEYQYRRCSV